MCADSRFAEPRQTFRKESLKGGAAAERSREAAKICCDSNKNNAAKRRRKDLILLVGSCCLGELNRGLENLEAPERKTDWYFLRRAKSTAKTRSDAQKLATGNFLCVRAESLYLPDGTLRVLFSPPLAAFLLFPAGNFSILFVRHKKYDKKALPAGSLPPPAALFLLLPQQVLPPPAASFPAESRLFSC